MRQAITENVWEQPGCDLGRLWWPAAPVPLESLSAQECAGFGPAAPRGWLLPQAGFGALWV